MTVDEYESAVRQHLLDAGFDFNNPTMSLAWTVFKQTVSLKVDCHDSYLFWEAAQDYFDFVREFRHYENDQNVWHEQVTLHFTCILPDFLDIEPVVCFSSAHVDYDSFFQAVECQPEFSKGLKFDRWLAELRIDGC